MSTQVQVVDNTGWARTYRLNETVTQIGSDPGNDIVLDARRGDIMARHVQIVRWPDAGDMCRLVNLSAAPIALAGPGGRTVAPRAAADLHSEDAFILGAFTLTLSAGDLGLQSIGSERTAITNRSGQFIGLELILPASRLGPGQVLEGEVVIRNLGESEPAQCELDLEGLPEDCYQIESAPVVCPGGEERIRLRIYHRYTRPLAGWRQIVLRARAPRAYPAEEAAAACRLQVLPCRRHTMRLLLPGQSAEPEPAPPAFSPQPAIQPRELRPRPAVRTITSSEPSSATRPAAPVSPVATVESARVNETAPAVVESTRTGETAPAAAPTVAQETGVAEQNAAPEPEQDWWTEDEPESAVEPESPQSKVKVLKARTAID